MSDARRLAARSLLVLGSLWLMLGGCCGGCGLVGSMMGKGEGMIAGLFGAVILICMGLVMGGSLLFLRKLILDFNRVAAIIAAILSGIAVGLGSLSVLGAVIGIVMGRGLPGLISLAIAALGLAAFAQLLMFLIQVIKEPE